MELLKVHEIKFPGFGWEFSIDSTAFTVFGLEIQWYGIIISFGIVLSFLLFHRLATKKELIPSDSVYNVTLITVPLAIIGARFTYVVTKWEDYRDGSFLDMINIRNGGLAIYGAIIVGLIVVLVFNKIKKTKASAMLDAIAPAVLVGQIIGRWGNFFNAEAYGWTENVESFPWRMWLERVEVDGVKIDSNLVHPTFLYESLWNLLGLVLILFVLYRRKKFDGEIFCAYMGWYGFGRFFIEMIRADSLYVVGNLKFSVLTGALCFVGSIVMAVILYSRRKREKEELLDYSSEFASVAASATVGETPAEGEAETDTANEDVVEDEIPGSGDVEGNGDEPVDEENIDDFATEREELTGEMPDGSDFSGEDGKSE